MSASPHWLPAQFEFSRFGEWSPFEAAIYSRFCTDFLDARSPVLFRGRQVVIKKHPQIDGREAAFWHCISEGQSGEQCRNPDFERCARIPWLRPCIEHADELKVWVEKRNGDNRIHIWLESEGYLVILAERKGYLLLWTAFHVRHNHERVKYERRYANAQNG
jgi:hypothetical protein